MVWGRSKPSACSLGAGTSPAGAFRTAVSKTGTRLTIQYLSIFDGPTSSITNPAYSLEYLGRIDHPFQTADFRGNRFDLVIRDLSDKEARTALELALSLESCGLPNYFDDQRFGSVGTSGEFIGQAWLAGNAERALELALAEPNPADRSAAKAEKAILRECWGRWAEAKKRLDRSSARSIVTYLVDHPTDFRRFARMRRELRTLYFSAFQSNLWNLIFARSIEHVARPEQRLSVELKTGALPFPCGLEPAQVSALRDWLIPLPSSRNALPEGWRREVIEEVLARFQLTWPDLRVRHLKDVFFSKGTRPAIVFPKNLEATISDDKMHHRQTGDRPLIRARQGRPVRHDHRQADHGGGRFIVIELDVLYEDNHCLVVNKPAGLLSQGDRSGERAWSRSPRTTEDALRQARQCVCRAATSRLTSRSRAMCCWPRLARRQTGFPSNFAPGRSRNSTGRSS